MIIRASVAGRVRDCVLSQLAPVTAHASLAYAGEESGLIFLCV